jgi:hypothetical protein
VFAFLASALHAYRASFIPHQPHFAMLSPVSSVLTFSGDEGESMVMKRPASAPAPKTNGSMSPPISKSSQAAIGQVRLEIPQAVGDEVHETPKPKAKKKVTKRPAASPNMGGSPCRQPPIPESSQAAAGEVRLESSQVAVGEVRAEPALGIPPQPIVAASVLEVRDSQPPAPDDFPDHLSEDSNASRECDVESNGQVGTSTISHF